MNLSTVFNAVVDSAEYAEQPHVVDNFPHVSAVLEQIENRIGREAYTELEDSIMELLTTLEYQGFVSGYKLACNSHVVAV